MTIRWDGTTVSLQGGLSSADIFAFARALNVVCTKQGYREVNLNFAQAFPVRESFMVPAIALLREHRRQGVGFQLRQPDNLSAKSIFHNANWAHLIDDFEHPPTTFEGEGHLPASSYTTAAEQTAAVDRIMSMILKAVPLQRKQLAALEWSVSEISDNVSNHSQSAMGGVIQASTIITGGRQMVEFVVADAGIGIKRSLGETKDARALERAIQEGVTRNPATNQGNGLYGSFPSIDTLERSLRATFRTLQLDR
jgi:anti-sigma regulatory factor (Ser/Thr protein kinase)